MDVRGKRVLITGGGRRVGAVITRVFAEAGAEVVIHCRRFREEAQELAASLPGSGHRVIAADFSEPGAVEKLLEEAGVFQMLVNNASCYTPALLAPGSYDADSMRVNFLVPVRLTEALAAFHLPEAAAVHVIDQAVLRAECPRDAYHDARRKLAEKTWEQALAFAPQNLRVNAVAPGPMLPPAWLPGSTMTKTLRTVPLGRRIEPEELARAVLFLMQNDGVTGAILPVDGGQHLFHSR